MICLFCSKEISFQYIKNDVFHMVKCHDCDIEYGLTGDDFVTYEFEVKPNITLMYEIHLGFSLWKWTDWEKLRDELPQRIDVFESELSYLEIDQKLKMIKKVNTILNFS